MYMFAQKGKTILRKSLNRPMVSGRNHLIQRDKVNSILDLQHMLGNQSIQRYLKISTDAANGEYSTIIARSGDGVDEKGKLPCNDKHRVKQFIAPGKNIRFRVKPKCTVVFNHLAATYYTYQKDPPITKRPYYQMFFRGSGRYPSAISIPAGCRGPKCHFRNPSRSSARKFKYAIPSNTKTVIIRNPSSRYKLLVNGNLTIWGR